MAQQSIMNETEWKLFKKDELYINKKDKDKYIRNVLKEGYELESENDYQLKFRGDVEFGWTAFILLMLLFNMVGIVGYFIYFFAIKKGAQYTINIL